MLFSATYNLCSKIIGNKKIEGSPLQALATSFVKLYDTAQVQSNTEVYLSFATNHINPVITVI